jgi:hypothetical protein
MNLQELIMFIFSNLMHSRNLICQGVFEFEVIVFIQCQLYL